MRVLTVSDFVPLSRVTHVFAPKFALREVREIFQFHGWSHIKVLDVRQEQLTVLPQ